MRSGMTRWVVVNGSPRLNGKSARVVRMLKLLIEQRTPEVELVEFEVGRMDVSGCNGCEFCRTNGECVMDDDMTQFIDELDSADRVLLVVPVYFAGVPSQMKAVLDRLQPYFWPYLERKKAGETLPEKRPLSLFVVGDGGDPHGYDPLVASVRSSMALAGFSIDEVIPLIGIKHVKPEHLGKWGVA